MKSAAYGDFMSEPHRFTARPYGLASWTRASWLDHFQVTPSGAVDYIWLGYADTILPDTDPRQFILCGTFYYDSSRKSPEVESAKSAARLLVNLSLPKITENEEPSTFMEQLFFYVDDNAARYNSWETLTITVDRRAVTFRQWSFAGGYAAFSCVDSQRSIAIVRQGFAVDTIELVTEESLSKYGVDADDGVRFSDLFKGTMSPARSEYHPDFERFLGTAS